MQIIPMRDLKNTVEVERRCAEEEVCEAKTVMEGLNDIKEGRTVDGDTAISNIKNKYGI